VLSFWGEAGTFDGEDSPSIVSTVFEGPQDQVEVVRWDAPMHTLTDPAYAAAFLRTMGLSEEKSSVAAGQLELPMTLTMRGCFVYATKG
jgi:hypothetical protein